MSPVSPLWKSLEEYGAECDGAALEALIQEFPAGASVWASLEDPVSRRRFLQIMGASMALAGITACTRMPPEKIIPYVVTPEELIPGVPQFFSTSFCFEGYAKGVLAKSYEGRPTKLEGNPDHPASLGKSDIFLQAELLQLYDPERARVVQYLGETRSWDEFISAMFKESTRWKATQGEGVRILSRPTASPTLLKDLGSFLALYPKAKWHAYGPLDPQAQGDATRLAYGAELSPLYDFSRAKVVLSLDSDFLGPGPAQLAQAAAFMGLRKSISEPGRSAEAFNRLYVVEPSLSITGACADHRWPVRPHEIKTISLSLAHALGVSGAGSREGIVAPDWLKAIASDLLDHRGECLVIAGERQSPEVQALAFAMNEVLGNQGRTLNLIAPIQSEAPPRGSLEDLVNDMSAGNVSTLIILGGNPAYDAPASLGFEDALKKVALRVRWGLFEDETSYLCHWSLPESHFLESWGDGRAFDGTVSLQQPLISPLYESRPAIEILSVLLGQSGRSAEQAVKDRWKDLGQAGIEQALREGIVRGTQAKPVPARIRSGWVSSIGEAKPGPSSAGALPAVVRPDPTIWDGSYSNNAWLQELPKPILQLTWSNAVLLGPETAKKLGLEDEDEVELRAGHRTQRGSVLRVPGHPEESATLYLGYGRSRAGKVGTGHGYDAYALLDHRSPGFIASLEIRKLGKKSELALTHLHSSMEGRDLVVRASLSRLQKSPAEVVKKEQKREEPSLLADVKGSSEAWAMVIDLTICIGCKACTIACQAENNIPVVGRDEVRRSREMHWIRVDRYFEGPASNPKVYFQPVPCMHCEKAPCEVVCPTMATAHSHDGLNQMIYNRCVGTRYCSNNCPYKVRRFNFFQYADVKTASIRLMYNPDVTVRSRGVMEKCTYCVQRIQEKRIEAEKQDRRIRDGELQTACQQACPTDAIVFGDQNDSSSRVSRLKGLPQHYMLLNELGTRPRTTYLASIRNPNFQLEKGEDK